MPSREEIYETYGYMTFPRDFGLSLPDNGTKFNFRRTPVNDPDDLLFKSEKFSKTRDHAEYITHNASHNGKVLFAFMLFDFDGKHTIGGLETARNDVKAWYDIPAFAGIDKVISMTSNTGFHGGLKLEPEMVDIADLHYGIKEFQERIKRKYNLESLDPAVTEPVKLMRLPLTPYVYQKKIPGTTQKKWTTTEYNCIPLDRDSLDLPLPDLLELNMKMSDQYLPDMCGKRFNPSIVFKLKDEAVSRMIIAEKLPPSSIEPDYLSMYSKLFISTIKETFERQNTLPVYEKLFQIHPDHNTRLVACVTLKSDGISIRSAKQIIARISEFAKWEDRNLEVQDIQIRSIYSADYKLRNGTVIR